MKIQEKLDIAFNNGVNYGRKLERTTIVDILEKKDWFGKSLTANERLKVIKWLRDGRLV